MSIYYRYEMRLTPTGNSYYTEVSAYRPGEEPERPRGRFDLSAVTSSVDPLSENFRWDTATRQQVKKLGEALFEIMFAEKLATHFRKWYVDARKDDAVLQVILDLNEADLPETATLPWELLRAPATDGLFPINFATDAKIALSRRRVLEMSAPKIEPWDLRVQLIVKRLEGLGPKVPLEPVTALP